MRVDSLRSRGRTISLCQTRTPLSELYESNSSESAQRTPLTPATSISQFDTSQSYSTALRALKASNENLEIKMIKLNDATRHLKHDLSKLEQHIRSFRHDLLPTWQADTLTRLIEIAYITQGRKLPGGLTPWDRKVPDRWALTRAYSIAAEKISHNVLWRKLKLPIRYHLALRKYGEIVEFRSSNAYQSECPFAQWLVSEKENSPGMFAFWARLFPLCYNRTVEESSEIIPMP